MLRTESSSSVVNSRAVLDRTPSGLRIPPRRSASIEESEDDEDEEPAGMEWEKETKALSCLRVMMMVTLLAASIAAGVLTYQGVRTFEKDDFLQQYNSAVTKLAEGFQQKISVKVWSAKTFSALYTSRFGPFGVWPNATMPDFEQQASGQLQLVEGRAFSFNPIITEDNRAQFESHAAENAIILGSDNLVPPGVEGMRVVADGIFTVVEGNRVDDPGYAPGSRFPGVMVPVWSIAPIDSNWPAVMFNLHGERNRQRALDDMIDYKVPVLTALLQLVQDEETRPSSILFYPVFNNFQKEQVVGSISIVFSWDEVFRQLLPEYINGMICVLKASSGQSFTYSITGDNVTLLGEGDLHDPRYDSLGKRFNASMEGADEKLGRVQFLITYSLEIYPSKELEGKYLTQRPAIFTAVVVLIFFFTSAVFLLYDFLSQHRQNIVVQTAVRTSKIVDSLFPAIVRKRIYITQEEREKERQQKRSMKRNMNKCLPQQAAKPSLETPAARLKRFFNIAPLDKSGSGFDFSGNFLSDSPIADMFPETTILFADIAGFTTWSSEREPHQVFQLLETLYREFDAVAKKMGVFKVETIGDCYVAVTGLPEPQEDHAVRMAMFAMECVRKTREVAERLSLPLGDDTRRLRVRSGLHSGKVTAGVLRGQKSRFQLFGDTMNTASRMESTGRPDRIQISQATADLLLAAGKSNWFNKRKETVHAKGKGELTTYWLEPLEFAKEIQPSHRGSISSMASSVSRSGSPDFRRPHENFNFSPNLNTDDGHRKITRGNDMGIFALEIDDDVRLQVTDEGKEQEPSAPEEVNGERQQTEDPIKTGNGSEKAGEWLDSQGHKLGGSRFSQSLESGGSEPHDGENPA